MMKQAAGFPGRREWWPSALGAVGIFLLPAMADAAPPPADVKAYCEQRYVTAADRQYEYRMRQSQQMQQRFEPGGAPPLAGPVPPPPPPAVARPVAPPSPAPALAPPAGHVLRHSMDSSAGSRGLPWPPGPAPGPNPDRERYPTAEANPVREVAREPVSTFSADVDTASYANVRRFLRQGGLPPRDAVRTEEMVNYFDYAYPLPEERTAPFRPTIAVYPTPWNPETRLLQIGIRGYDIPRAARPAANLVFLMDVSGSMQPIDRLPLAKAAICLLVHELDERDRVSLAVYSGSAGAVLEPTRGSDREAILAALDRLEAGGSTAGGQGIELAYRLAKQNFDPKAVNRIILASDGDFNVGVSDPARLGDMVARERASGVFLTILGFGGGNYNDAMMQQLAQLGNGMAAYVDDLDEGRRILVDKMTGSLFVIARDVKFQVEFNPARVREYRLIGYETRMLRREDFSNDAVDAGEVGAGHSVTALYEIVPAGSTAGLIEPLRYGQGTAPATPEARSAEYGHLRIRYKLPDEQASRLIERPVTDADVEPTFAGAPADMRFAAAVAGFAQLLRQEPYLRNGFDFARVRAIAEDAAGADPLRRGFAEMVRAAQSAGNLDPRGRPQR